MSFAARMKDLRFLHNHNRITFILRIFLLRVTIACVNDYLSDLPWALGLLNMRDNAWFGFQQNISELLEAHFSCVARSFLFVNPGLSMIGVRGKTNMNFILWW